MPSHTASRPQNYLSASFSFGFVLTFTPINFIGFPERTTNGLGTTTSRVFSRSWPLPWFRGDGIDGGKGNDGSRLFSFNDDRDCDCVDLRCSGIVGGGFIGKEGCWGNIEDDEGGVCDRVIPSKSASISGKATMRFAGFGLVLSIWRSFASIIAILSPVFLWNTPLVG